jgi:hypothetical protein
MSLFSKSEYLSIYKLFVVILRVGDVLRDFQKGLSLCSEKISYFFLPLKEVKRTEGLRASKL